MVIVSAAAVCACEASIDDQSGATTAVSFRSDIQADLDAVGCTQAQCHHATTNAMQLWPQPADDVEWWDNYETLRKHADHLIEHACGGDGHGNVLAGHDDVRQRLERWIREGMPYRRREPYFRSTIQRDLDALGCTAADCHHSAQSKLHLWPSPATDPEWAENYLNLAEHAQHLVATASGENGHGDVLAGHDDVRTRLERWVKNGTPYAYQDAYFRGTIQADLDALGCTAAQCHHSTTNAMHLWPAPADDQQWRQNYDTVCTHAGHFLTRALGCEGGHGNVLAGHDDVRRRWEDWLGDALPYQPGRWHYRPHIQGDLDALGCTQSACHHDPSSALHLWPTPADDREWQDNYTTIQSHLGHLLLRASGGEAGHPDVLGGRDNIKQRWQQWIADGAPL